MIRALTLFYLLTNSIVIVEHAKFPFPDPANFELSVVPTRTYLPLKLGYSGETGKPGMLFETMPLYRSFVMVSGIF